MTNALLNHDLFAPPTATGNKLDEAIETAMRAVSTAPCYALAIEPSQAMKQLIATRTAQRRGGER